MATFSKQVSLEALYLKCERRISFSFYSVNFNPNAQSPFWQPGSFIGNPFLIAFDKNLNLIEFNSFSQSYSKNDVEERHQGSGPHKGPQGNGTYVAAAPGGTLLPDFPKPSKLTLPEDVPHEKV